MQYILIGKNSEHSIHNDCPMWRLTWYCIDDGSLWEMTVDETFRNWPHWRNFVTNKTWGIYTAIRRTKRLSRSNLRVASADSRPELVESLASQAQAHDLAQKVADYHSNQMETDYDRLFRTAT